MNIDKQTSEIITWAVCMTIAIIIVAWAFYSAMKNRADQAPPDPPEIIEFEPGPRGSVPDPGVDYAYKRDP